MVGGGVGTQQVAQREQVEKKGLKKSPLENDFGRRLWKEVALRFWNQEQEGGREDGEQKLVFGRMRGI